MVWYAIHESGHSRPTHSRGVYLEIGRRQPPVEPLGPLLRPPLASSQRNQRLLQFQHPLVRQKVQPAHVQTQFRLRVEDVRALDLYIPPHIQRKRSASHCDQHQCLDVIPGEGMCQSENPTNDGEDRRSLLMSPRVLQWWQPTMSFCPSLYFPW